MANGSGDYASRVVESPAFKVLQLLVTSVLVPLMFWMVSTLVALDRRVTVIESNRFTIKDAAEIRRDLESHRQILGHPAMEQRVNALERRVEQLERNQ